MESTKLLTSSRRERQRPFEISSLEATSLDVSTEGLSSDDDDDPAYSCKFPHEKHVGFKVNLHKKLNIYLADTFIALCL